MEDEVERKLDNFFFRYKRFKYKKGEILIRADDSPSGIFYLKRGVVKEYAISKRGEEVIVNIFKPVSFFPMSWAVNNTPNVYYFESMDEVSVWRAPKDDVIDFVKHEPDVLFDLLCRVYRGTDGLLLRLSYLMAGSAYSRLIIELITYVKRFNLQDDGMKLAISEVDLASQTGMSRETVSREMRILKDKGILTVGNGGVTVVNFDRLQEEVEGGV